MVDSYGVLLLDGSEVIIRIYRVENDEWKLNYYFTRSMPSEKELSVRDLAEVLAEVFTTAEARDVIEWKICSRGINDEIIHNASTAIGIQIEALNKAREQELLSKGMFTELW